MSATQAKQSFGEVLRLAAAEPVAIERHRKVLALVAAPEHFEAASRRQDDLTERRLARANQALLERDRLIRHHRIAFDLVTLPAGKRKALVEYAQESVRQWRERQLCSPDYIERWMAILALPPQEMALAIVSDLDGWGNALRQNSPWNGVLPG